MGKIAEPTGRKGRKLTPATNGSKKQQQKKARPSSLPQPDTLRHHQSTPESETRRSLRRLRRRQYYCDYYEDFDDDFEDFPLRDGEEEDEEQETKRKEKKLNLVLKKAASPPGAHHLHDRPAAAAPDSSDCENKERHPLKKRKISGCGDANDNADDDCVRSILSDDEKERIEDGVQQAGTVSIPGSPSSESRSATQLPDRKVLELILDKLQKKDTYGVYAEPVDPEELPDYHDVIENPMDFTTVRKKLASGAYVTLEQLESDIFLICSNAMQYNAPETIYFKQARTIQDLARKKFDKLKADEIKSVQKTRSTFETEKPIKKHLASVQEHGGSDFFSGATFVAPKDACALSNVVQDGSVEKHVNGNVNAPSADGNCFLTEKQMDKVEDVSVKESPLKFGKKLSGLEENRRATYISNQSVVKTECIFSTFENETKQLIAVGLHADHSYARSLARFAALLGPTAWAVASRKIEQALPAGYKFGRGWVGEYEPLPTPVLTLEKHIQIQLPFNGISCESADPKKEGQKKITKVMENGGHKNLRLRLGTNLNASTEAACRIVPDATDEGNTKRATLEGRPVLFGSPAVSQQPKKSRAIQTAKPETNVLRQADVSCTSSMNSNPVEVASWRLDHNPEVQSSGLLDIFSRNRNPAGATLFKQPEMRLQGGHSPLQAGSSMGLPNGNSISSSDGVKPSQLSLDSVYKHPLGSPSFLVPNNCQQGLDDPVELMRKLSEKSAMGQPALNPGNPANSVDLRIRPSAPYIKPENSNASAAAARAWMSIGPASPYIPIRDNLIPVKSENNNFAAPQASRAVHVSGEAQQHDRGRLMTFPQNMDPDSSRFQNKSHWQGLTNAQKAQKRDMLPPDLNIGFQAPASPVRQSSGILVDSQQPDLALQL